MMLKRKCFLVILLSLTSPLVNADCEQGIDSGSMAEYMAPGELQGYLAEERQRQQLVCAQTKGLGQDKAIYVQDNRIDVYRASGLIKEAALSTAALINPAFFRKEGGEYVAAQHYTLSSRGWCTDEPFAAQPVMAHCTAFLVGPKQLVTAGHCLRNQFGDEAGLAEAMVVFGFQMINRNEAKTRFPASDVYFIHKELEVKKNSSEDWAVLELDRPVTGKRIFEFEADEIETGTPLTIIGYPNGLPLKIADGGSVQKNNRHETVFITDLDSYHGNSGSPVLNSAALKQGRLLVEGILVSGARDADPSRDCKRSIVCDRAMIGNASGYCSGEIVTKINRVVALDAPVPDDPLPAPAWGAGEDWNALPEDLKQLFMQ